MRFHCRFEASVLTVFSFFKLTPFILFVVECAMSVRAVSLTCSPRALFSIIMLLFDKLCKTKAH
jgi:hypothetical protein